ncbi:hypothetical protein [Cryptosporangium minutisporangium]|uniref:Uncharacterized protein n=1 Tax=Cryptosporangium minutisporangium TaxID=113569 RepID=A0ABP6STR0_9ACTN
MDVPALLHGAAAGGVRVERLAGYGGSADGLVFGFGLIPVERTQPGLEALGAALSGRGKPVP